MSTITGHPLKRVAQIRETPNNLDQTAEIIPSTPESTSQSRSYKTTAKWNRSICSDLTPVYKGTPVKTKADTDPLRQNELSG